MKPLHVFAVVCITAIPVFFAGFFTGTQWSTPEQRNPYADVSVADKRSPLTTTATTEATDQADTSDNLETLANKTPANTDNFIDDLPPEVAQNNQAIETDIDKLAVAEETYQAVDVHSLWADIQAVLFSDLPPEAMIESRAELANYLAGVPGAHDILINKYQETQDPREKAIVIDVLSEMASPEAVEFASDLINEGDSDNAVRGYTLLAAMNVSSPETFVLAYNALQNQTNTEILSSAIHALTPTAVSPAERQHVVDMLHDYTQHNDTDIRTHSLQTLVKWDQSDNTINVLEQTLINGNQLDRIAAINAIKNERVINNNLKPLLLETIQNPDEDLSVRAGAIHSLQFYSLDEEEYKIYRALFDELEGGITHADGSAG